MYKRVFYLISFFLSLFACNRNPKTILKQISTDKIQIEWYYESYISNRRVFVLFKNKRGIDTTVICNDNMITDININNDTVVIKMFKPGNNVIYQFKPNSLGYYVKIDSSVSYNEYNKIYQPDYYKPGEK